MKKMHGANMRGLSVLLCVLLTISLFPATALAEESGEAEYTKPGGDD